MNEEELPEEEQQKQEEGTVPKQIPQQEPSQKPKKKRGRPYGSFDYEIPGVGKVPIHEFKKWVRSQRIKEKVKKIFKPRLPRQEFTIHVYVEDYLLIQKIAKKHKLSMARVIEKIIDKTFKRVKGGIENNDRTNNIADEQS